MSVCISCDGLSRAASWHQGHGLAELVELAEVQLRKQQEGQQRM
jgi:hypothetical protein